MYAYLNGKRIRLDPAQAIGKGGEADIFAYQGQAVKIFKGPDHPDLDGWPAEQQAAVERLKEHQRKLPEFPRTLPAEVIAPDQLVYDNAQSQIIGYTMRFLQGAEVLLRYGERVFRQAGIGNAAVVDIFKNLHATVTRVHGQHVVIGDFNDLNVLVSGNTAYLIDADSFQYGSYYCRLFTGRFVDPLHCDQNLKLVRPHDADSDWYAFAIMLMQSLLFVHPYGGMYTPKDKKKRLPHDQRPLKRITVFHPEVVYPKPAVPYLVLPDDLLHYFERTFVNDQRGVFPFAVLQTLRWTTCSACGHEHGRSVCPFCRQAAPAAVKETVTIRGRVTATRIFTTPGLILYATHDGAGMRWLYHEQGAYKREKGEVVMHGPLDPHVRYRICGPATLFGKRDEVFTFDPAEEKPQHLTVDTYGTLPIFDASAQKRFWLTSGRLMADGELGQDYPVRIGETLPGQTLFWVGPKFGFGFYRAGDVQVAFVFDAHRQGLNDNVKIPRLTGQLVDSTCAFSKERCWFFCTIQEGGKLINRVSVLKPDGSVQASAECASGDGSWLGTIRGKAAMGPFLFAATDNGIARVEVSGGTLAVTREFPDTEPFVNAGSNLFAGTDGLYVVNQREIFRLQIS